MLLAATTTAELARIIPYMKHLSGLHSNDTVEARRSAPSLRNQLY